MSKVLSVRIDDDEYAELTAGAQAAGVDLSTYAMALIREGRAALVTAVLNTEYADKRRQLERTETRMQMHLLIQSVLLLRQIALDPGAALDQDLIQEVSNAAQEQAGTVCENLDELDMLYSQNLAALAE